MTTDKTGPVTLAMLAVDGKKLWLYCNDCHYNVEVEPLSLGLPPDTPVPTLGRRHMKCSKCGSKDITSWPELYKGRSATDP